MTKSQKLGILSICLGVVLFLPLLFTFMGVAIFVDGINITAQVRMLLNMQGLGGLLDGMTFLGTIEHIGTSGVSTLGTLIGIGTILLIVLSVALIAAGILLVCKKFDNFVKLTQAGLIVAGAMAMLVALFGIIEVASSDALTEDLSLLSNPGIGMGPGIMEMRAVIGFGTIFLMLVGITTLLLGCFAHKLFKDGVAKDGVTKEKAATVKTERGSNDFDAKVARLKQYKADGVITEEMYKQKMEELINQKAEEL